MEEKTLFTSHSKINSYPPNVINFSTFYNCREHIYVLKPGDALFIPKGWFHWVFSYPDTDAQNIALSYRVNTYSKVFNEFIYNKPFVFNIDVPKLSLESIAATHKNPVDVFVSKKTVIVPVDKHDSFSKATKRAKMTFDEMIFCPTNVYAAQTTVVNLPPPAFLMRGFSDASFTCFNWFAKVKGEYIDSGLHYDNFHGLLIQIKGTKVVRMYKSGDAKNLYLSPMTAI